MRLVLDSAYAESFLYWRRGYGLRNAGTRGRAPRDGGYRVRRRERRRLETRRRPIHLRAISRRAAMAATKTAPTIATQNGEASRVRITGSPFLLSRIENAESQFAVRVAAKGNRAL